MIAAVGASAGGVEALRTMFRAARPGAGVAYVVQLHLDPDRASSLAEILARDCALPVETAAPGSPMAPDRVLVIPPGVVATIVQGRVVLTPDTGPKGEARQIDALFASLALDRGERAVGVVLSGFGTDGTLGVKAIKEHGGLTIAQGSNGTTPAHHGMPDSAIAGGLIDLVLPAQDIAAALATYAGSFPALAALTDEAARREEEKTRIAAARAAINDVLRREVGHDFSGYKEPSFLRRVQRRMQVLRLTDIEAYVERLRQDHDEALALLRDLLISVTSFFRDAEAFAELADHVIPRLFEGKGAADAVRVWVPGCATGEEAFSIAILLREYAAQRPAPPRLQVFATDIDEAALQIARAAHFPETQLDAVSPERLARFFTRAGAGRQVVREIRDICVFSAHSLIRDPPFSRLDLVSCRNLLIYLDSAAQRELFPVFHFALRPGGYLLLGSAESATQAPDLFRPVDKLRRIYQRRDHAPRPLRVTVAAPPGLRTGARPTGREPGTDPPRSVRSAAEQAILERFAPAHVVVNREAEVIHFSGHTGRFLEAAPGQPTRSLLSLARRGLRLDLRTALADALRTRRPTTRSGLDPDQVGRPGAVSVTIEPLAGVDAAEPLLLVVFSEAAAPAEAPATPVEGTAEAAAAVAEQELRDTQERLQTLIEEYETAAEELRASNEELVSVNEELQSANEELETSKEEQQSVNEELQTVNQELQSKVEELDHANADLRNLFDATGVATIVLDRMLAIRSFTPAMTALFNLLPTDRGRPLADIAGAVDTGPLLLDARLVLGGGKAVERRIGSRDGRLHFLLRVLPYKAAAGTTDGVIAALVDVTQLVEAVEARDHQRLLVGELNHRVRNMLQAVLGLTRQTLRDAPSPEEFGKALTGRMHAMAQAYQLISREQWGDVLLQDLVAQQLGAHLAKPDRGTSDGPRIALRPAGAVAFGLVLHELATNAIKYGALSTETGVVAVTWEVVGTADAPSLRLHWQERDGPAVTAPDRTGFGSQMVKGQVERALRGRIQVDYAAAGVQATITVPLHGEIRLAPASEPPLPA